VITIHNGIGRHAFPLLIALLLPALAAANDPWRLVWSDEFDGAEGSLPDAKKWHLKVNGDGGGNQELQFYTARAENAHQQGGHLVITARKEHFQGPDGRARDYTSARLETKGLFARTYGRFEARLKIPRGQGMWPAFWMLGADHDVAGWPGCGEIDVMENIGREPATIHGTIHGPGYSGGHGIGAPATLPGSSFADKFHVFAVEWRPDRIDFFVDDTRYATRRPSDLPHGTRWVYDHPFYIIVNLAVGGGWPGSPDATTHFPQQLVVDYVRVYAPAR
jgi:beta-glucanase (GH16 family)